MNEKKFLVLYQRQQESGLTVQEFCSNEIIAPATFYYWKKKLQTQKQLPNFIPVVVNSTSQLSREPLPERVVRPSTGSKEDIPFIEIEFPNKAIVRIKSELDLPMLKALIHLND